MGSHRRTASSPDITARLRRLAVLFGATGVVLVAIAGWSAWSSIERVPFEDAVSAADVLETIPALEVDALRAAEDAAEEAALLAELEDMAVEELAELKARLLDETPAETGVELPFLSSPELPDDLFTSYLMVGVEGGFRADAIIYLLRPSDGSTPIMVSLPRDLYLRNPCTDRYTRVNAGLGGCAGYAGGAELLSLMVKEFTGIEVDHFARVDFGGFRRVSSMRWEEWRSVSRMPSGMQRHFWICLPVALRQAETRHWPGFDLDRPKHWLTVSGRKCRA